MGRDRRQERALKGKEQHNVGAQGEEPQILRIKTNLGNFLDIWEAGEDAHNRGDTVAAVQHFLQAEILVARESAKNQAKSRVTLYQSLEMILRSGRIETWKPDLWKPLIASTTRKETNSLYRAYASFIYGSAFALTASDDQIDDQASHSFKISSKKYLELTRTLCDSASDMERHQQVQMCPIEAYFGAPFTGTADILLDDLRSKSITEMEYLTSTWKYYNKVIQECGESGLVTVEDIMEAALRRMQKEGRMRNPVLSMKPKPVTSAVVEGIVTLPRNDQIVLIVPNAFPPQVREGAHFVPGLHDRFCVRAFTVDMDRFSRGETTLVFDQIKMLLCDPAESRQKNLLATFASACLQPYVHTLGQEQQHPAARPSTVLLTPTDSMDPNVLLFLEMMGILDISEAGTDMLNLLNNTFFSEVNARSSRHVMRFSKTPLMHDISNGIHCMNCHMVGSGRLKMCPCGGAWFCSKACQRIQWPAHKQEHKIIMKSKQQVANNPKLLLKDFGGIPVRPFYRFVSSNVMSATQAPLLLHLYLSIIEYNEKKGPFVAADEPRIIDSQFYLRDACSSDELFTFVLTGRGHCSLATAKALIDGPAFECDLTPSEINKSFDKYGVGLVCAFDVYSDFKPTDDGLDPSSHEGIPSGTILGKHSMILFGVREHQDDNDDNCMLLLQNCWESKPFVQVDLNYFRACNARLVFFAGPPKAPDDAWSKPMGDITCMKADAGLQWDDYWEDEEVND